MPDDDADAGDEPVADGGSGSGGSVGGGGQTGPNQGGSSPDLGPESPGYGALVWPIRRSTRPSLDTLQHDQRTLVYTGEPSRVPELKPIVDGFDSRRELVNWYQAATVRTFGHLADWWPPVDLERDLALVGALTEPRPHDEEWKEWLHTRSVEALVLPACGKAYQHLRDKSSERTATDRYDDHDLEDWSNIDPEEEHHIGMRPGYSRLDAEQADVFDELWGGFDSRGQLGEWFHSLSPATYGTFGAAEAADVLADHYGRQQFLADTEEGRLLRERFAIIELLPKFADAARRLRAGEQSETEPDDTWRQG